MLRYVPSIATLVRVFFFFYHEWMLDFVKCFFCIYWDDHMIFDFFLLMWCMMLIDLRKLYHPCEPGMNPTWSWCIIFLVCCWIQLAKICWEFFCLYSSKILAYSFLFWWYLCLVLELGWWWHHRMSLGVFLLPRPFEKV